MYIPILGLCLGVALVATFSDRSLPAMLGAILFAGSALALLVLFVVSIVRSVRSRTLNGGQLFAAGILLLLVLFVVQRFDAPSSEPKIERAIGKVATGADPAYCDELMTGRYLVQTTGEAMPFADEACESEAGNGSADSVEVREITVNGDQATAIVAHTGGSLDGSEVVVQLLEEDGVWKLDQALGFVRFDRASFRRVYRRKLEEFGFPAKAVDCILDRERHYPDEEIEREAIEPDDRVFAGIVIACGRAGVERNVIGAIENSALDPAERVVECGRRRLKRATDAELMRAQTDVFAYNELILACGRDAFLAFHRRSLSSETDLDQGSVECVIGFFEALPARKLIEMTYEEERYEALLDQCESRA
jgi:hypothetical protein